MEDKVPEDIISFMDCLDSIVRFTGLSEVIRVFSIKSILELPIRTLPTILIRQGSIYWAEVVTKSGQRNSLPKQPRHAMNLN